MAMKQSLSKVAGAVGEGAVEERAAFLMKTYAHLAVEIGFDAGRVGAVR